MSVDLVPPLGVSPEACDPSTVKLTGNSYVINSEAMKKLYATMKNRPNSLDEPKDLSREWHSDCSFSLGCILSDHPIDTLYRSF